MKSLCFRCGLLTLPFSLPTLALGEGVNSLAISQDSAIRLVVRQIKAGTDPTIGGGVGRDWISQPGAIRRLDYATQTIATDSVFKLYSAPTMRDSVANIANDLPADWQSRTHEFADLNAAQSVSGGEVSYPIADPRADAEGFTYETTLAGTSVGTALPMPVRWLYVLQDGTLGYLNNGTFTGLANQPTGLPASTPAANNPIVGRTAFWADDLSCKVNVNTASEGVFWDSPRCDTTEERHYAKFQPVLRELQREMGHPAAVCLSSVLFPGKRYAAGGAANGMNSLSLEQAKEMWKIGRVIFEDVGSIGGTLSTLNISGGNLGPEPAFVDLAEIDAVATSAEVKTRLARSAFLLTTRGDAVDYTVTGKPRISMWPVFANDSLRTSFDRALVAGSSVGGVGYFLQRQDAFSRHNELTSNFGGRNKSLWDWLKRDLGSVPLGFATSLQQKYRAPGGSTSASDADALSLLFLDYVRGINSLDPHNINTYTSNGAGLSVYPFGGAASASDILNLWNAAIPIPRGIGRSSGISEIIFYCICRAQKIGASIVGTPSNIPTLQSKPDGTKELEMGFLVETFSPQQGPGSSYPKTWISFNSGTGNSVTPTALPSTMTIGGTSIGSLASLTTSVGGGGAQGWTQTGGNQGVRIGLSIPQKMGPIYTTTATGMITLRISSGSPPAFRLLYGDAGSTPTSGNQAGGFYLNFPEIANVPAPEVTTPIQTRLTNAKNSSGNQPLFDANKDIVRSWLPSHGDYRMSEAISEGAVDATEFVPHPRWASGERIVHSLTEHGIADANASIVPLVAGVAYPAGKRPDSSLAASDPAFGAGRLDAMARGSIDPGVTGDWDNGTGPLVDGPWANFPDEGDTRGITTGTPYFDSLSQSWTTDFRTFSPYRMVPSAVMFGSLPTGTKAHVPWQTPLFRPDPHLGTADQHYGSVGPKDHLLLDLFNMPVVTPWRISEPLSRAGAINLNYQILPFRHIKRATALHALLKAQKVLAIPTTAGPIYKTGAGDQPWRHFIDATATLAQWESKFAANQVFSHASELCDQWLVPEGESLANMPAFWEAHKLTGDNSKERPYANIYPHLTTRSNSFQLHLIVQAITKSPNVAADIFDPAQDQLSSSVRKVVELERSIDPNQPGLPDYATATNPPSLETFAGIKVLTDASSLHLPALTIEPARGATPARLQWKGLWYGEGATLETSTDQRSWQTLGSTMTGEPNVATSLVQSTTDGGYYDVPTTDPSVRRFYRVRVTAGLRPVY
jgi:hypothetical protein